MILLFQLLLPCVQAIYFTPQLNNVQTHTILLTKGSPIASIYNNKPLSSTKQHVWKVISPDGSKIVVRHSTVPFYDHELWIYDQYNTSLLMTKDRLKFISPSNSITLKLLSLGITSNLSNTYLASNAILSVEMQGFCAEGRKPCGTDDPDLCYLVAEDRCDGQWDCPNSGADEMACFFCHANHYPCESDTWSATNMFLTKCYPAAARCDGKRDCLKTGFDELECTRKTCSLDSLRFLCESKAGETVTGQCIPLQKVCDTVVDCASGLDEAASLCVRSDPMNTTQQEVAKLIAHLLMRNAIDDCLMAAQSRLDASLRTVLTYALAGMIGPLLTVCTISFVCRTRTAVTSRQTRITNRRTARFNTPIMRMLREEIRRRPPPPTYSEAMNNSLFEEPVLEGVPEPPLVTGPLTREQILSVRERALKPLDRVDVACSCHLPTPPPSELGAPSRSESSSSVVERHHAASGGASNSGELRFTLGRFLSALRSWRLTHHEQEGTPNDSEVTTVHDHDMHPSPSTTVSRQHSLNSTERQNSLASIRDDEDALDEFMNAPLTDAPPATNAAQTSTEGDQDDGGGGDGISAPNLSATNNPSVTLLVHNGPLSGAQQPRTSIV